MASLDFVLFLQGWDTLTLTDIRIISVYQPIVRLWSRDATRTLCAAERIIHSSDKCKYMHDSTLTDASSVWGLKWLFG